MTAWLKELIRDIPDFPQAGVVFKDITPLLADAEAFGVAVSAIADYFADRQVDKVAGIEARGFIVASPVAWHLGAGFVPMRKAGKLPWRAESEEYLLEYGTERLEVHQDALSCGDHVVIVDDVLATGGTAAAAIRLVERLGGEVVGLGFLLELGFLGGRSRIEGRDVLSLTEFE